MQNLSYGISPILKDNITTIEDLRVKILLTPLSAKNQLRFLWEAMINRIYWSLILNGGDQTKTQVTKVCMGSSKKPGIRQQEIIKLKRVLEYISYEWNVSQKTVSARTILNLHDTSSSGDLRITEKNLKFLADYLAASSDHPVIQAGIAHILLEQTRPFTNGNGLTARLLAYLFLYKYGYDFRGLLVLEEYWGHDKSGYLYGIETVRNTGKATLWLEYFSKGVIVQLEKVLANITSLTSRLEVSSKLFDLNDRQKSIFAYLEQPEAKITNKNVQKKFKVSQITASRDLGKLATLSLIFARGKGRSVYYTRV